MNINHNTSTYNATQNGSVRRIRTPHPHDVLSGRGGGINGHAGNVQFREWVRVRKNDYNLAPSKVEKARVAQEVIELVRSQDPPGRFLQKDSSAGIGNWWVELDEDRVVAKTSQALREGAPQIRAAHQQEINEMKAKVGRKTANNNNARKVPKTIPNKAVFSSVSSVPAKRALEAPRWPAPAHVNNPVDPKDAAYQEKAMMELRTNVEQARLRNDLLENDPVIRAEKRMRMDEAGNSAPTPLALPPPIPSSIPRQSFGNEQRQNSLALSEFSFDAGMDDFVNPFADETEQGAKDKPPTTISIATPNSLGRASVPPTPRPGMFRQNSSTSNGEFAGLKSLTAPPAPPAIPTQEPVNRSKSGQSVATQISKLDWDDSDPLLAYLTSLDRGVAAQ